jgi:glycosyltransferase involved in cell wall biosynthesis
MRVCVVYDCLFPYTVGGAERWYRNLAERLARDGHEVTYLTLRQWERGTRPSLPGVRVVAAGPRMGLYGGEGQRRVTPPLVFGVGVLRHMLRFGRSYDVVHTASFPYFSLLAIALLAPVHHCAVVVDWLEVWTRAYWREYLGPLGGRIGWLVQRLCVHVPQRAFCFSRLHAGRLLAEGFRGTPTVLEGLYGGRRLPAPQVEVEPVVVFAGRHIPEKRVPALVDAFARAHASRPELRLALYGDGPDFAEVTRRIAGQRLDGVAVQHGFVAAERIDEALRHAACLVLPSRREGYGLVVVEAASCGTPSVVVAGPDSASTELIAEGENGTVAPSAAVEDLAAAMLRVVDRGAELRGRTRRWFAENVARLSLESSLERISDAYRAGSAPVESAPEAQPARDHAGGR